MTDSTLTNLKRKLARWELDHLRKHAAELAERLEIAEEDARHGWECAESWREDAMQLMQEMIEDGRDVGLTKAGGIVLGAAGQMLARGATLVLLTESQSKELSHLIGDQKMHGGSVIAQVWPDGFRAARITNDEHDRIQEVLGSNKNNRTFRSAAEAHADDTQVQSQSKEAA